MSAENISGTKPTNDNISEVDSEDKKFVSQAVAFVIGHARNGFVALCASVATLLKDQAKLKQEVKSLQQDILQLQQKINSVHNPDAFVKKRQCTLQRNAYPHKLKLWESDKTSSVKISKIDTLKHKAIPFHKLNGCICNQCIQCINQSALTLPLNEGDRVVIRGELFGVVRYVGHVDSLEFPEIYAGIEMNEAIGDSDGSINNKVFFSGRNKHCIFVPLPHILCVMK